MLYPGFPNVCFPFVILTEFAEMLIPVISTLENRNDKNEARLRMLILRWLNVDNLTAEQSGTPSERKKGAQTIYLNNHFLINLV